MTYNPYVQAGTAIAKYGAKMYNESKQPSFAKSELGKYYAKKKAHGLYGSQGVQNMANQYGKFIKRGADDTKSDYKGSLINRGVEGSIAGIRGANEITSKGDVKIADYYDKTMQENELSKDEASKTFADLSYKDALEKSKRKSEHFNNLINDVSGVAIDQWGGVKPSEQPDPKLAEIAKKYDVTDPDTDIQPLIDYMMQEGYSPDEIEKYLKLSGWS